MRIQQCSPTVICIGGSAVDLAIWIVLAIGIVGWGLVTWWKQSVAKFWLLLAETNHRHGTNFGTSPVDKATLIGADLFKGGVLAFDRKNRKIAYMTRGGKSIEILAYSFIRSWAVTWREKQTGSGAQFGAIAIGSSHTSHDKVFLELTTNDVQRPIIRMPMSSLEWARDTAARLEIMMNSKV